MSESDFLKLKENSQKYSLGDDDVLLVELAEEKASFFGINYGSSPTTYFSDFSNNKTDTTGWRSSMNKELDAFEKNPQKYALIAGTGGFGGGVATNLKNKDGVNIAKSHFYAIESVCGDKVSVVNPWDSSATIELSRTDFLKTFGHGFLGRSTLE